MFAAFSSIAAHTAAAPSRAARRIPLAMRQAAKTTSAATRNGRLEIIVNQPRGYQRRDDAQNEPYRDRDDANQDVIHYVNPLAMRRLCRDLDNVHVIDCVLKFAL